MKDLNLLESLIENNSIKIGVEAKDWKDAVIKATQPLVYSGAIKEGYGKAIIKNTEEYGPYYIIADGLAMPHARPEDGVIKNAFSLITLKTPVKFKGDDREVSVLMALGATSSEIHVSSALPQVVAVFEEQSRVLEISKAKTKEEIIKIIKSVDFSKYLGGN